MAAKESLELFDKVTARIPLEKKKYADSAALEGICKQTGASYHEAVDMLLVTGTWNQIAKTRKQVMKKLGMTTDRSGSSSSDHSDKAISSLYEYHCDTEPYMAKYINAFRHEYLKEIERYCHVKITWAGDETRVWIKSDKLGSSCNEKSFKQACDRFIEMYQDLYNDVNKVTFNVSRDSGDHRRESLKKAVSSAAQAVGGLILEKAADGRTYDMWGTKTDLTKGQEWIRSQLRIYSSNPQKRSLSPRPVGKVLSHETANKLKIVVYQGDITNENADIIVNACNKHLDHAGGVSWAISKAGGPTIQQESDDYVSKHGTLCSGDVAVTGPGFLKCKNVVHAVGPQWQKHGKEGSVKLLKEVFNKTFQLALQLGAKSIAIPAISSGIYGVPKEICAWATFSFIDELDGTLASNSSGVTGPFEIRLVNIDEDTARVFGLEFNKWTFKGRKVERRHSFGGSKKKDTEKPVAERSADDMHKTPKIKANLSNYLSNSGPTSRPSSSTNPLLGMNQNKTDSRLRGSGSSSLPVTPSSHSGKQKAIVASHIATVPSGYPACHLDYRNPTAYRGFSLPSSSGQLDQRMGVLNGVNGVDSHATTQGKKPSNDCPICQSPITDPEKLSKCGHQFCKPCIKRAFSYHKKCPVCQEVYGVAEGDQPDGTMRITRSNYYNIPGYEGWGCFIINYDIPSGLQSKRHPNPGKQFQGTMRKAYLPATKEGEEVLKLLQKAFDKKLIFTVGTSTTTGKENCVTWNDIHHKTSMIGGPQRFGYPDPGYLSRVKDELKAKGIVPD